MKRAFDHCASDYAQYRPGYPPELFEMVQRYSSGLRGRLAVDLGAGSGIFAHQLLRCGCRVIAVDPSTSMLRQMASHAALKPLCASAEHSGLQDGVAALVSAAQAFHWFNPPRALAEIARILRPGGVLLLCWNNRDGSRCDFVGAYEALIQQYNAAYQREYRQQDWSAKIAAGEAFTLAQYHCFEHCWTIPAEDFVGFSRSVSYIRNVLSQAERRRFESDLRHLLQESFGHGPCSIPLRTDVWICNRSGRF